MKLNYHTEGLSGVIRGALCVTAGGGLVGKIHSCFTRSLTLHTGTFYLSCLRGRVFRLNIGLAEGEERGLMEDRKENAQQTERKKSFRILTQIKKSLRTERNCMILRQWSEWENSARMRVMSPAHSFHTRCYWVSSVTLPSHYKVNLSGWNLLQWPQLLYNQLFHCSSANRMANRKWHLTTTSVLIINNINIYRRIKWHHHRQKSCKV